MKPGALAAFMIIVMGCTLLPFRSAQGQGNPPEFTPNDPRYVDAWARLLSLPKAWAYEQTAVPKDALAVVAVFGEWVDCSHPDLQAHCLPQYTFNATDRPLNNGNHHERAVASIIAAGTNNSIGPSSIAGLMGRVKFISIKVGEGNLHLGEWFQAGLRRVIELKQQGLNIVAVNCSFVGGAGDQSVTRPLLDQVRDLGIHIFAAAPTADPPLNLDTWNAFPATWSREYSNIVAVTALREDGQALTSVSPYGPQTIAFAAPGQNVQVVGTLDPLNSSASFGGTSAATPHAAAVYALVRVYAETDPARALERLKLSARMIPALEGKVSSGIPDAYDALTMPFGCPAPSSLILWVTERNSSRAVALDSVVMTGGPFLVTNPLNFFALDRRTRLMLFAYNINLQPNEDAAAVAVHAQDSSGNVVQLPVEYVGRLSEPLSCLAQINVRLLPELTPGDVSLRLSLRGQSSLPATIAVRGP